LSIETESFEFRQELFDFWKKSSSHEMMDMAAIRAAKKELRTALKQSIANVDKESVAAQCTILITTLQFCSQG